MEMSVSTDIEAPAETVWNIIADIEHAHETIEGIDRLEVLEPATGPSIIGLKWRETRTMFGKQATEVMWITDAEDASFYETRAESHGAIYKSRLELEPNGNGTRLTMSFEATPETFGAKVMWVLTGWMAKGAMRKTLHKDLADIKTAAEK